MNVPETSCDSWWSEAPGLDQLGLVSPSCVVSLVQGTHPLFVAFLEAKDSSLPAGIIVSLLALEALASSTSHAAHNDVPWCLKKEAPNNTCSGRWWARFVGRRRRSSVPNRVPSLWWSNDLQLHLGCGPCRQILRQALATLQLWKERS